MRCSLAFVAAVLAANFVTAFLPCRDHIERVIGSIGQQIKLRADFPALSRSSRFQTTGTPIVQSQAPWGLARISHRQRLAFSTFNKYVYDPDAGQGVNVYVVDTGVNVNHAEFEGRAIWGQTVISDSDDTDTIGTGTHFAGIIASRKYGVAKKANIIGVKALGLSNPNATDVISGVNWAIADHQSKTKTMSGSDLKGSVILLNVGNLNFDTDLKATVDAAFDAGIHVALSAGNDNSDACKYGAADTKGLTVGASTLSDERAYFSNWGKCVDLFGPGLNILSTSIGSETATSVLSSTETAAAHVAGLLAYLVSQASEDQVTPDIIKRKVLELTTPNLLNALPPDTVNQLAYNGVSI